MKRALPVLFLLFLGFLGLLYFRNLQIQNASAAAANYIVISEVQVGNTGEADDEFLELYNPTASPIDLTNWRIARKSSAGNDQTDLVASVSGSIPSRGYFLFATAEYTGTVTPDQSYSATDSAIASNNTLILHDSTDAVIDTVGMGTATASETATIANPVPGGSIERKANSLSDETNMGSGGTDELAGNSEDTDDNSSDFIRRGASNPQNSQSATESVESPSPTIEPSPTVEPSVEPSPTIEPTVEPSPTTEPTPSLSPTPSIPGPIIIAKGPIFTCTLNYKPWKLFNKTFFFPFIHCARTSN